MATSSRVRLADARVFYIDRCKARDFSEQTVRTYNALLSKFIRDVGDILMENITPRHVEDWLFGQRMEHVTDQWGRTSNPAVTPSTFNQQLSCLRAFFKWAQSQGYLRHNPTGDLRMMKVQKKARFQATPDQMLQMIEITEYPRDRFYIALAVNTGLRQNELLRIRIRDVRLDLGYIAVVITKTGEVDDQPISADLDRELRTWLVEYQAEIGRALEPDDFLVPNTYSPLILSRDCRMVEHGPRELRPKDSAVRMEKVVQGALGALGLPTYYEGTHTIRRSVARAYFDFAARNGGDVAALRETAQLLHHSNLQTTERYLGTTAEKEVRNRRLKGRPFMTALVDQTNVVRIAERSGR